MGCKLVEVAEGVERAESAPQWRKVNAMFALRLDPAPRLGEAASVVNGHNRRYSIGPTNMWMSDSAEGLPQDLVLTWDTPQTINEICLTFDNLCRFRHENPWENATRVAPHLAKAYELDYWADGGWHKLVYEDCNYHRFRRYSLPTVRAEKIRLRVLMVHGESGGARVYAVRASYR